MGATTEYAAVTAALDFKNAHTFFLGTGRPTAWTNELEPPPEETTTSTLDDLQALKLADTVSLCRVNEAGDIVFAAATYSTVTDENAYSEVATMVYVKAFLSYDAYPTVSYRQRGLYIDVVPAEIKDVLIYPADVSYLGYLIQYANHTAIHHNQGTKELIEFIIRMNPQVS